MARIAIDCRFFGRWSAGLGRYVEELVKNLADLDRKNHYFLLFNKRNFDQLSNPARNMEKVLIRSGYYSLAEQTLMPFELARLSLDLVHFTHFNHPLYYRGRFIVNIHDLTLSFFESRKPTSTIKYLAYRKVVEDAAKRSEKIITLARSTAKEASQLFSLPEEKFVTIPIAVDERYNRRVKNQKSRIKRTLGKYRLEAPYLIYVGQQRPHKNLVRLIEAFDRVSKAIELESGKTEIKLVLAGESDQKSNFLQETILKNKLAERVKLTGFIPDDDLPFLVAGAEIFLWPSLNEGFGLPPLEAMALGVPVVSSNRSAMPEVLGRAAHYFDPENVSDMAEKIRETLIDDELKASLSKNGFKQVKKYSWLKMAAETLRVYQAVLNVKTEV